MARTKGQSNGRLEEAMANLLQTQALFVQNQAAFLARMSEMERINSERFARIEALLNEHTRILIEHSRILSEHTRILQALPEAIREKIGFKPPDLNNGPHVVGRIANPSTCLDGLAIRPTIRQYLAGPGTRLL
jgi:hypothetical protein